MSYKFDTSLLKPLNEQQEDDSLAEFGYSKKQLKMDLEQIREWLESQKYLPPSSLNESDTFLEHFLIACKGSLEKVKNKLDCYYTMRAYSEIHKDRDPLQPLTTGMKQISEFAFMPEALPDGTRLCLVTFNDSDPEKYSVLGYCRNFLNRIEIFMRMSVVSTKVYIMIDCNGISPTGLIQFMNINLTRDLTMLLGDGLPFRYIKIICINVPSYAEVVANKFIRPFFSKKLKERYILTSGGFEDLLNYFSPSMLPKDYGGLSTNPSLKEYSDRWAKCEEANRQWYLNELSEKNDETKRISLDYLSENSYFGVHGSLKKLVID